MAIDMSVAAATRIVNDGIIASFEIANAHVADFVSNSDALYSVPNVKVCPLVSLDTRAYATPELAAQALIDKAQSLKTSIVGKYGAGKWAWGFTLVALGMPFDYQVGPGITPNFTNHESDCPAGLLTAQDYNPGQQFDAAVVS